MRRRTAASLPGLLLLLACTSGGAPGIADADGTLDGEETADFAGEDCADASGDAETESAADADADDVPEADGCGVPIEGWPAGACERLVELPRLTIDSTTYPSLAGYVTFDRPVIAPDGGRWVFYGSAAGVAGDPPRTELWGDLGEDLSPAAPLRFLPDTGRDTEDLAFVEDRFVRLEVGEPAGRTWLRPLDADGGTIGSPELVDEASGFFGHGWQIVGTGCELQVLFGRETEPPSDPPLAELYLARFDRGLRRIAASRQVGPLTFVAAPAGVYGFAAANDAGSGILLTTWAETSFGISGDLYFALLSREGDVAETVPVETDPGVSSLGSVRPFRTASGYVAFVNQAENWNATRGGWDDQWVSGLLFDDRGRPTMQQVVAADHYLVDVTWDGTAFDVLVAPVKAGCADCVLPLDVALVRVRPDLAVHEPLRTLAETEGRGDYLTPVCSPVTGRAFREGIVSYVVCFGRGWPARDSIDVGRLRCEPGP